MKKRLLKIILPITFLFILISTINVSSVVKADIGFDGDYDSGYDSGGGYGGWYDDDDDDDYYYGGYHSSNSSGGSSGSAPPEVVALAVFITLLPPIIILLVTHFSSKRKHRPRTPDLIDTRGMEVDDDLNMQVYLMYKELNDAWMKKDLEPIRHLLTDEMYNMYLMQLDTLIEQNQTNIMKDYLFVSGHVYSRRKYKGKETTVMIFRIKCRDYIIDDTTNKVIRGKEKDIIDYTYEFKLVRNVEAKEIVCPSCGYMIQNKEGVVCPHCSSVVHTNTNTWRLADKRVLRQTRRRK